MKNTTIAVPARDSGKYARLKPNYTIAKLGCKIPMGSVVIESLRYVTELIDKGELIMIIEDHAMKLVDKKSKQ